MRIDLHCHDCGSDDSEIERKLNLIIVALDKLVESVGNIEKYLLAPTIVFTPGNPVDKEL